MYAFINDDNDDDDYDYDDGGGDDDADADEDTVCLCEGVCSRRMLRRMHFAGVKFKAIS